MGASEGRSTPAPGAAAAAAGAQVYSWGTRTEAGLWLGRGSGEAGLAWTSARAVGKSECPQVDAASGWASRRWCWAGRAQSLLVGLRGLQERVLPPVEFFQFWALSCCPSAQALPGKAVVQTHMRPHLPTGHFPPWPAY